MNAHKRYLAKLNLLAKIHKAIAPILETKRKADELLDRCIRSSHEKQRYCCLVGDKYNGHVYRMGTLESNLASENDTFHTIRTQASNQARRDTYQASK